MSANFLVIICVILKISEASRSNLRIIGGRNAEVGKYPFVVILEVKDQMYYSRVCTGSLISDAWVLSAAHCFDMGNITHILYGNISNEHSNDVTFSEVIKTYPHPNYAYVKSLKNEDLAYSRNDIGLLQVKSVKLPHYGKLCADDYSTLMGQPTNIIGFGLTTNKKSEVEKDTFIPLQETEGLVVQCDETRLNRMFICVSYKCGGIQYAYLGDSGGPLLYDGKIAGVFSQVEVPWGLGFYFPVSPHFSWIHDVIKQNDMM